jgi:hypothetical protein
MSKRLYLYFIYLYLSLLYLYKNGAFRGVKWERRDVIIGVLNKTTFFFILKKYEEREV